MTSEIFSKRNCNSLSLALKSQCRMPPKAQTLKSSKFDSSMSLCSELIEKLNALNKSKPELSVKERASILNEFFQSEVLTLLADLQK